MKTTQIPLKYFVVYGYIRTYVSAKNRRQFLVQRWPIMMFAKTLIYQVAITTTIVVST